MDSLIALISGSPVDLKVKIFQVLDTVVYHHRSSNIAVPLGCLQLPDDLADNVAILEQYIAEVGIANLPASLQTLGYLRPMGAPKQPLLPPKIPSSTLGQTLAQMPLTHDHSNNYQYVRSWEHAQALLAEFATTNNKQGKTAGIPDCVDFPSDSAGQLALVGELFAAAVDYDSMKDKQARSRRRGANNQMVDSAEVARFKAASNVTIELICWKLLLAIKNAQDGNIGISGWKHPDTVKYDKYPTFRARFDTVMEALRKSKTTIDHLMATEFVLRLAAAPKQEYRSVKANLVCNSNKQTALKAGQQAVTRGHFQKGNDGNIRDQNGNVVATRRVISDSEEDDQDGQDGRQKKRQRMGKTASKTETASSTGSSLPPTVQPRGRQSPTLRLRTEIPAPGLQPAGPQAPQFRQEFLHEQARQRRPWQPVPIRDPSLQPQYQQPGPAEPHASVARDRPAARNPVSPEYQSRAYTPSQQSHGSMPRAPLSPPRTGIAVGLLDLLNDPVTDEPTPGTDLPAPSAGADPSLYPTVDPQLWLFDDKLPDNTTAGEGYY